MPKIVPPRHERRPHHAHIHEHATRYHSQASRRRPAAAGRPPGNPPAGRRATPPHPARPGLADTARGCRRRRRLTPSRASPWPGARSGLDHRPVNEQVPGLPGQGPRLPRRSTRGSQKLLATSAGLSLRSILASKHLRGPCGVRVLALCLVAIFVTVESCLAARVFSIEVFMTHSSRWSRKTSPAGR